MTTRGLLVAALLLVGCDAAPEQCDWSTLAPHGWTPTEIENGCNLHTLNTTRLGCDGDARYINQMTPGEDCTKAAEWSCGYSIRATVWFDLEARRGYMTLDGPGGCVTTAVLVETP